MSVRKRLGQWLSELWMEALLSSSWLLLLLTRRDLRTAKETTMVRNAEQADAFITEFADKLHNPQILDCP